MIGREGEDLRVSGSESVGWGEESYNRERMRDRANSKIGWKNRKERERDTCNSYSLLKHSVILFDFSIYTYLPLSTYRTTGKTYKSLISFSIFISHPPPSQQPHTHAQANPSYQKPACHAAPPRLVVPVLPPSPVPVSRLRQRLFPLLLPRLPIRLSFPRTSSPSSFVSLARPKTWGRRPALIAGGKQLGMSTGRASNTKRSRGSAWSVHVSPPE